MRLNVRFSSAWQRKLAPTDRYLWLLWAVRFHISIGTVPVWEFVIYWKRLAVLLFTFAVGGYLAAVTVVHRLWARQPETHLRWQDIALAPVRWDKFREQRGDVMIAAGMKQIAEGKFAEASFNLRAGLARSPANVPGRMQLAALVASGDPVRAVKLLEQGLAVLPDQAEFLGAMFDLWSDSGATTLALTRSAELLAPGRKPALGAEARAVAVNARAALLLSRSDAAGALALLQTNPRDFKTASDLQTVRLTLRALRALGRDAEAAALFALVPPDANRNPRIDVGIALAAQDAESLETALRRLKAQAQRPASALLFAFEAWHELKRTLRREAVEEEIYRFHDGDETTLQALGALAVRLDLPGTLLRAQRMAARKRFNPFAFQVHTTELMLRRGDLAEAERLLEQWENTLPQLAESQRVVPELLARTIRAAGSDRVTQTAALTNHFSLNGARVPTGTVLLVMRTLEKAGNWRAAAQLAETATRFAPLNDELREQSGRLALRVARETVAEPTAAPKPKQAAESEFTSGAEALAAIDQALRRDDAENAVWLIQGVRKSGPAWLSEVEPQLAMREYRARRALQQGPAAMLVFRDLALKPGASRAAAFRLVRDYIAAGEGDLALQLAREIERLLPGEKAATVLLREAEGPPIEKNGDGKK